MSDAKKPLLEVDGLQVQFTTQDGNVTAVHEASLSIGAGETLAIVGESGSGKSTTAMSVIGLLPGNGRVSSGSIRLDGEELVGASEAKMRSIRGRRIGLVPQDPMSNLNPVWSIGSHIKEALKANNVASGSEAHKRAIELMEEAGLPDAEKRVGQYPHEFSGGMRQRALIACGLAARPQLLIADEPTSALDVTVQQQILDHLQGLTTKLGTAVMLITHDLGLAAERAHRIVVMSQGHVVETGPALEILQNPQHPYTQKLVAAAPSLAARRSDVVDRRAKIRAEAEAAAGASDSQHLIEVEGLTKVFKVPGDKPWQKNDFVAADNVNFWLDRGHTLALVGESGSGKSTVAQMVLGLLEPTEGRVMFDGQDVTGLKGKDELAFRRRVQPVFQNPYGSIDPMYSVYNTIAEPLKIHKVGDKKSREARVRELLEMVAMPQSMMHRFPGELSGGQRQRVAIARALALGPEALILDEAVSALDVLVQSQILDLLNNLQAEMGLTYLFITHDLAVVKQIADETLVMQKGKIVERGETDDLFANPREEYTQKLLNSIPGGKIELYS